MTAEEEVNVECDTKNPNVETDDAKQDESNYKIDTTGDDEQTTRKTPQDQRDQCEVTRNIICAQYAYLR